MIPTIGLKYRKDKPNKKGNYPIIIQVIFERTAYKKSTGISFPADRLEGNLLTGDDRDTYLANVRLRDMISDIDKKLFNLYATGNFTHENIKQVFADKPVGGDMNLLQVFTAIEKIYQGVLSESRFKGIKAAVNKFNKWFQDNPAYSLY